MLATGAAATAMAAVRRVFGQETGKEGAAMSFYEKGPVRIHYEQVGSGFPTRGPSRKFAHDRRGTSDVHCKAIFWTMAPPVTASVDVAGSPDGSCCASPLPPCLPRPRNAPRSTWSN